MSERLSHAAGSLFKSFEDKLARMLPRGTKASAISESPPKLYRIRCARLVLALQGEMMLGNRHSSNSPIV